MKKNIIKFCSFFTLMFFFPAISFADLTPVRSPTNVLSTKGHDLSFGVGNFCEQIRRVQTDDKGNKNLCTYRPFVSSEFFLQAFEDFHYGLFLGTSLPQSAKDENTNRMVFLITPTARYFYQYFHFQIGLGLQLTRIWGNGGEVSLNNGNTTQTFNVPNESRVSRNTIAFIGTGYSLFDSVTLNSDLYVLEAFDGDKRAFSLLLQAKYHFGEIF